MARSGPPGDKENSVAVAGSDVAEHHAKLFLGQDRYWLVNLCGLPCMVLTASGRTVPLTILEPTIEIEKGEGFQVGECTFRIRRLEPPTEQHLSRVLKDAVQRPTAWIPPKGFKAYDVSVLARQHHVPFAVLTNYADQLGVPVQEALDALKVVFGADAAFNKDEAGLEACAAWVRQVAP